MSTTPRKRLTGEERRAAILDAALAVFAERGYHASSIDDIAREGGISKALIYEHFASKQDLYAELLEQHAGELFSRARRSDLRGRHDPPRPGWPPGFDAFYGFVEEHRRRLAHAVPRGHRPRGAWRVLDRVTTR